MKEHRSTAISTAELELMGIASVAYVKPVAVQEGQEGKTYTIHAADGTAIALANNLDDAVLAILSNDMRPVAIH